MKINIPLLLAVGLLGLTVTSLHAQVAINNSAANPDASAILDLQSGNSGVNKGFLPQAVTLTNVNTAAPVVTPAVGLIVYSPAGPVGGNGAGYYYWNGLAWASMNSSIGGTGSNNFVARWTPNATTLGTGMIEDNGTTVGINSTPTKAMLYVNSTKAAADSAIGATIGVYGQATKYGGYFSGAQGVYGSGSSFGGNFVASGGPGVNAGGTTFGGDFTGSAGPGVYASGTTFGGDFTATTGPGVNGNGTIYGGQFTASAGQGVYGTSTNAAGDSSVGLTYGVYGKATAFTVTTAGVYGNVPFGSGTGVYGNSPSGTGVYGNSSGGTGVYGNGSAFGGNFVASGGPGVYGSGTSYGGQFTASAGAGVYGSGTSFGGQFTASAGAGVYGTGSYGVYGSGTTSPGLYGVSTRAAGDSAIGVTHGGYYTASAGAGVYGGGTTFGGNFKATAGAGVYGVGNIYGVEGIGNGSTMPAVAAGTGNAFCGTTYGLFAAQTTAVNTGIGCIYTYDAEGLDFTELNAWNSNTHYKVFSNIPGGSVTCAAYDLSGQKVLLHCPETPEFYYEDYGEGQLVNGKAHIDLDPILAKNVAISEKHPLRVFIQLEDNETCKGVIVKNKTGSGFDVVELNGGTSNTPFEWHVVCNVKDAVDNKTINHVQDLRFEKAPATVIPTITKN